MFSPLTRGYGSWAGEINLKTETEVINLPSVTEIGSETHRHGVTVTPRISRSNTNYSLVSRKDDGQVDLPKTYLTRKGALLLFSAPPRDPETTKQTSRLLHWKKVENLMDSSLKLNTLERLYLSALQYGDLTSYSRDKCSITDPDNQWFLKFLHGFDEHDVDFSTKPGGDFNSYLRDLKTRVSSRVHGSSDSSSSRQRSQELRNLLQELEGVWRSKSQASLKPESTTLSHRRLSPIQRILSSKSLTASIKSSTYLGRADSSEANISAQASPGISHVALPDITNKHGRRKKASWVSSASTTDDTNDANNQQPVSITRVPTGKRPSSSAKSGSSGRHSADSKASSGSSKALDGKSEGDLHTTKYGDLYTASNNGGFCINANDGGLYTTTNDGDLYTTVNDGGLYTTTNDGGFYSTASDDGLYSTANDGGVYITAIDGGVDNGAHNVGDHAHAIVDDYTLVQKEGNLMDDPGVVIVGAIGEGVPNVNKHAIGVRTVEITLDDENNKFSNLVKNSEDSVLTRNEDSVNVDMDVTRDKQLFGENIDNNADMEKVSVASSMLEAQDVSLPSDGEETIDVSKQQQWPNIDDQQSMPEQQILIKDTTGETGKLTNILPDISSSDGDSLQDKQIPRPPSVSNSSQGCALRLSGRSSRTSNASTDVATAKDEEDVLQTNEEKLDPTTTTKESNQQNKDGTEENKQESNDDTESEQSLSFIFVQDNSTSPSASVGKRDPEEDIAEVLERRRRARLLSNLQINNSTFDEAEDDFAERAKQAEQEELDFIFLREAESDDEHTSEQSDKASRAKKRKPKSSKPVKKPTGEKVYITALDVTSIAPSMEEEAVSEEINDADDVPWIHPNQRFFSDGPQPKFEALDDEGVLPSHLEEMLNRRSASKSAEELEAELQQMQDIMNKEMAGSSMMVDDGEAGLTEEELKLAQELLQDRVKEVSSKIFNTGTDENEEIEQKKEEITSTKKVTGKNKRGGKVKKKPKKPVEPVPVDRKISIAVERDSIRQQRKLEKLKRLEEMRVLQEKITQRESLRKTQEEETRLKAQELIDEQISLEEEAAAIKQAEEEARLHLAEIRQSQRQERESRRKTEQERKRQLAINRREREKTMTEIARQKEQEMLQKIGDAETRRELLDEEEKRNEEEDRLAQESFEEELREQQAALEEDEIRMRELEKEAEEEAMQRLIEEREETERRRRRLKEEEIKIRKQEELQRQTLLLEEERLREEKALKELEEQAKLEEERKRLQELKRLEDEARQTMRVELDYKREWALKRRTHNLDRRSHLDKIRIGQGLTRPWVFSYFVLWPKDSFCKQIGSEPKKTNSFQFRSKSKPKEQVPVPPSSSPEPEFMPGLTSIEEE